MEKHSIASMLGGRGKSRRGFLPLVGKTVSLIVLYSVYGLLQERIIKGHYKSTGGTSNDTFSSAPLLVLCNRLTSLATGLALAQMHSVTFRPPLLPLPHVNSTSNLRRLQTCAQKMAARRRRIWPASPLYFYALVAGLNNAATVSQYTSLSYLSFTTSTLGKSAKMIPVLILGHGWYGKRYKVRQWIGAALVILGIWEYLSSLPKIVLHEEERNKAIAMNWIGALTLLAYLFFDGLTSTMQERLFGQVDVAEDRPMLMGITSGIIDQMVCSKPEKSCTCLYFIQIWVNLFSSLIALFTLLLSRSESTILSLKLAMTSPTLQLHIWLLSITSTAGLLVLFNVIATYGALIASLIMTIRQFVSILCNAAWFGNITSIPILGWTSIGLIAAGIWIKMDRRYDEMTDEISNPKNWWSSGKYFSLICQYLVPIVMCPTMFVLLIASFEFAFQPMRNPAGVAWWI